MTRRDGLFIAFEGGDGAGKSTQVRLLARRCEPRGREVVVTRQPGGTALGAPIRDLVLHGDHVSPRAEALLFAADKAHHVDQLVGRRSSAARSSSPTATPTARSPTRAPGASSGPREVHDLQQWAVDGLLPDLTVVARRHRRRGSVAARGDSHDRLESEADAFHDAVRRTTFDWPPATPSATSSSTAPSRPSGCTTAVVDRLERVMGAGRRRDRLARPHRPGARGRDALARGAAAPEAMTHAWLFTGPARARAARSPPGPSPRRCSAPTAGAASAASAARRSTAPTPTSRSSPPRGCRSRSTRPASSSQEAALRPSVGRWRVIIIEDADRLTERARRRPAQGPRGADAAHRLDALRAQPRGRHRHDPLALAARAAAHPAGRGRRRAAHRRDGVDPPWRCTPPAPPSRTSASPRRLARDEQARIRRRDVIAMPTRIVSVGDAIGAASRPGDDRRRGVRRRLERARRRREGAPDGDARRRPDRAHPAAAHPLPAQLRSRRSRRPGPPGSPATSSTGRSSTCCRSTATRSCCAPAPASDLVNEDSRAGGAAGVRAARRPSELLARDGRHRHGPRADRRQRQPAARARGDGPGPAAPAIGPTAVPDAVSRRDGALTRSAARDGPAAGRASRRRARLSCAHEASPSRRPRGCPVTALVLAGARSSTASEDRPRAVASRSAPRAHRRAPRRSHASTPSVWTGPTAGGHECATLEVPARLRQPRPATTIELAPASRCRRPGVQAARLARRQPGRARRVRASTTPRSAPTHRRQPVRPALTTSSASTRAASVAAHPIDCLDRQAQLDAFLGTDPHPGRRRPRSRRSTAPPEGFAAAAAQTRAARLLAHVVDRRRRPRHGRAAGRARRRRS